jgi:hypothetical protein
MTCPYESYPSFSFLNEASMSTSLLVSSLPQLYYCSPEKPTVATYGSCFANRVAKHIKNSNLLSYFREEHTNYKDAVLNDFSSSIGNVYSIAQFVSLLKLSLNVFDTDLAVHDFSTGKFYQLMRPRMGTFNSKISAIEDLDETLRYFNRSIENSNFLVLTLGLTEIWVDSETELCLPTCPGCGWGSYDSRFVPHQLSYIDITSLLDELALYVRTLNDRITLIFTVSPVPLVATHSQQHALYADAVSKATQIIAVRDWIHAQRDANPDENNFFYFPSYEIVKNPFNFNKNFETDGRTVTDHAEAEVMKVFFDWVQGGLNRSVSDSSLPVIELSEKTELNARAQSEHLEICDEEVYWKYNKNDR